MQKRAVLLLVAAGLFVAAWACSAAPGMEPDAGGTPGGDGGSTSDSGTGGGDGGGVGLALDSACAVLNAKRCDFLQRCKLIESGSDARADCELYYGTTDCSPAGWPARAKEGTLRYDGAKAQACADAWDQRACDSFNGEPEVCGQLTSPAALVGGRCYGGPEQECILSVCTGGTCPRQCRAPGGAGEVCEASEDCKGGYFCRHTVSGGAIGTCTALRANGESCDADRPCEAGYYCGTFGVCQPMSKTGEGCVEGSCVSTAYCASSQDGGVCQVRAQEGQSCAADDQCAAGLLCLTETKSCAKPGPIAVGKACSRRQFCEPGLACVGTLPDPAYPPTLGECATPVAESGACTSSFDCEQPLACELGSDGGSCAPRFGDGEACAQDRDCQLFSRCENAQCVRVPRPGESCPSGDCLYGLCEVSTDGGSNICRGLGGPNETCTRNEQCASLRCVSGSCLAACTP